MAQMNRNRAQLILVAGLVLAVLFVGLALLVNTAIYTENVATRASDPGSEALEYRGAAVSTVGELIETANDDEETNARNEFPESIEAIDGRLSHQFARRGGSANIESNGKTDGLLILQRESADFTGPDGSENHTLVSNPDATREYVLDVESVIATSDPYNESFYIGFDERYYIYESSNEVTVATGGSSDTNPEVICALEPDGTEPVTVDLTGGVLTSGNERVECRGLDWPTNPSDDIEYVRGNQATGTYRVTVAASETDLVDISLLDEDSPEEPYAVKAVYDVTVNLQYDSSRVSYDTSVRVAPGEPRE